MDTSFYLERFKNAANRLDKNQLQKLQIEVAVGVVLNSACLKLYKKAWATPSQNPLTAESRIFFSVWIGDPGIETQKLSYNIHAIKLRKFKDYVIESRKFADNFRAAFKQFEHQWPNVSIDFGPLTLMEGWLDIDLENFEGDILKLANNFLEIEHLVDSTLARFKK